MRSSWTALISPWSIAPLVLAMLSSGPTTARAADALSLEQVVGATLANNTDLKQAALSTEIARGRALLAAAPFDSAFTLSGRASRGFQLSPPDNPNVPDLAVGQQAVTLGWVKLLRNGLLIAPEASTTWTRLYSDPRLDYARSSVRLRLVLPLLRDFGGVITGAPEREARLQHQASVLDERQAGALAVVRAASAYWAYLGAARRLEVFAASEARADRTATDIASLVKADERTRADLTQARGTLASRRANRMAAEQDLLAAWEAIAVLTGTVRDQVEVLPEAATSFPDAGAQAGEGSLDRFVAGALRRRPELRAAQRRVEAAEVTLAAARSELRPRVDLEGSAGHAGQQRGPGVGRAADALFRDIPGADVAVQLSIIWPVERNGPRGLLAERSAQHQSARLALLELERQIRIAVATLLETVKRSRLALRESEEAVKLLQQTVEGEKHKFKLGLSTLLAVIQAEDSLNSALLAKIEGQRAFAMALANLRFETATLLSEGSAAKGERIEEVTSRLTVMP